MAELYLIKVGNALRPAYEEDADRLRKMKAGVLYKGDLTAPRDQIKHRKFFALLNLAFSYWEPETMVSDIEKQTVDKLAEYLKRSGIDSDAVNALAGDFLGHLEKSRASLSVGRDFEQFRAHVTVAAGFHELVATPAGPKKVAKSISFGNMEQLEFDALYKSVLDVCWQICLSRCFDNQADLMNHLLRFE
jgi:hypothetical protein